MFSSIHTSYKKHTKAASIVFGLIVIIFVTFLSGVNPLTMIGDNGSRDYGTLNGRNIDADEYQTMFERWKPSHLLTSPIRRIDVNDIEYIQDVLLHAARLEKINAEIEAKKFTPKALDMKRKEDVERAAEIVNNRFMSNLFQLMQSGRINQQMAISLIGSKLDERIKSLRENLLIPGPSIDAAIQDLVLIADYEQMLTAGIKEDAVIERENARLATRRYEVRSLNVNSADEADKILKAEQKKQAISQPFAECKDRLLLNLYKPEAEKEFARLLKTRFTVGESLEVLEVKFTAKSQEAAIKLEDSEIKKLYEERQAQFKRQQFKGCIISSAVTPETDSNVSLKLAGLILAAKAGTLKADADKDIHVQNFEEWQDTGMFARAPDSALSKFIAAATKGSDSGVIELSPGYKGVVVVRDIRAEVPQEEAFTMLRKSETERRSARLANEIARKYVEDLKLVTGDKLLEEARKSATQLGATLSSHPAVERSKILPSSWGRLTQENPVSPATSSQGGSEVSVGILAKIVPEHPLNFGENGSDLILCRELNQTEGAKNAEAEAAKIKAELDKLDDKALAERLDALKFGKLQKASEASLAADLSSREYKKGALIVTPGALGSELLWIANATDADDKTITDKAQQLAAMKANQARNKKLFEEESQLLKNIKIGVEK